MKQLFALLLVLCCCLSWRADAHETQADWPSSEELAQVQPAMANSIPMARMLIAHLRNRLDTHQLTLLDEINHHLQVMHQVDSVQIDVKRQLQFLERSRLVEYFRWRAEKSLLKLLGTLRSPDIVELDFRDRGPQRTTDEPIVLDQQHNLVMLRVISGEAGDDVESIHFSMQEWDLISERLDSHFSVDIAATGTTYALLDLKQVPTDRTAAHLAFRDAERDETLHTYALTFHAAARGQLAIDVVDEGGRSIPVLMSIASHSGAKLWEPAEAIDLRPLLNDVVPHLSLSGRGYMFYLFGERRGRYWVVKPPLEMPLPSGSWEVRVLRGLEYSPIRRTIRVQEGEWTRVKLQPRRWTNMPQRGWYSGDDHVHARLLTSEDARKLIDYTRAVDINVANILEMGDVMRTYYAQRGFGTDFRVQHGDHWLVPGQEDPRSVLGHAIGLNLQTKVRDLGRYLSNDWVAAEIHRQGGLYGHTHVGANACFAHREMALFTPHGIVDFNSIMQASLGTELFYDFLNLGFKMTASAGADTPYGGTIGAVRTYAYTGSSESFSPDDWFAALQRGRTFVTNGPMLELQVGDAMPGDELFVEDGQTLRVTARTWGDQGWSAPQRLRLVKLGEAIEEVIVENEAETTLSLTTQVNAGHGFWIAAHAIAQDGSQAHTTPVYVTRKGFRHWNVQLAETLIDQQLATLREIEADVGKAETLAASGLSPLDYWNRRTVEQAEQVRANIEATRKIYEELRQKLAIEVVQRQQ